MTGSDVKIHGFSRFWCSLLPLNNVFQLFDFTENTLNRERQKSFGTQTSTLFFPPFFHKKVNFSWYTQPKLPRVKIRCTCTGEEYLHLPLNIQQLRDMYGDGEEVNTVYACSNYIN